MNESLIFRMLRITVTAAGIAMASPLAFGEADVGAGMKVSDPRREALARELKELHAKPGEAVWPEAIQKALGTAGGEEIARKILIRHGYLADELRWLDELPAEASADLRASMVVLQTRRLLREGPPKYEGLWPAWDQGDTPGDEAPRKEDPRAGVSLIARDAGEDPEALLDSLVPRNGVYRELHAVFLEMTAGLEELRESFLPIPAIKQDEIVKPGQPYDGAPILERRLIEEGYLPPAQALPQGDPVAGEGPVRPIYRLELSEAVKRYQLHHGRDVDGILGPDTLEELNRSPDQELEILRINLHRARMLPDDPGSRYVMVNVPSARVDAFARGEKPVLSMKSIVGEAVKMRQTPVFRDIMETVEFGPYWNVPASIAKRDIVPKARRDPSFFEEGRFEIVNNYTSTRPQPVNSGTLSQAESGSLMLRQRPGPKNALGSVKFLFPNDFHIYLHDTPDGHLFDEAERGFSNGCIRVERPADLAEFVLGPQGWTREQIEEAIASGVNRRVPVENPVNVYIIYLTAFPTWDPHDSRKVRFHPDIYGHDRELLAAGRKRPKSDD